MTTKTTKRISLVDGLRRDEPEPTIEAMQQFVKTGNAVPKPDPTPPNEPGRGDPAEDDTPAGRKRPAAEVPAERYRSAAVRPRPSRVQPVALVPVTIRLRPELAGALKRASLERQLAGEPVYTQQDMVEEALAPWLKKAGYL